jgi:hypothetical protein
MKFALAVIFTLFSITFTDALPLELMDWYTPDHASLATNNIKAGNVHEQTIHTDIKRTERHRKLDKLYSDQLFEESLFLHVPHSEV